ncbi:GntR family transcriptional regulator [Galactobacter sp.]|uniref:GntR family transcriptional regulator n=1 Tax=Galactobacter sp. TaxID=2676125 RepID=UPI0025C07391|nr:GntR family transcriptional regulator [Galactobacter sp.]
MALTPLEPGPLAGERAFEALHHAIVTGELPVGYRLRIRDLARELDISTMPVRQAIRRLEEQGLATSEPYRGAVVRGFSDRELLDLYAVRTLLETDATVIGIASLTETDLEQLQRELEAMTTALDAADAADYMHHDEAFLGIVYQAAGNEVMMEMIHSLWHRCRPYKLLGVQHELEVQESLAAVEIPGIPVGYVPLLEYQRQLLEAARRGDAAAARQATQDSLAAATRRVRMGLVSPRSEVDSEDRNSA